MTARTQDYKVKTLGKSGEFSLGKAYVGQMVAVEKREPGVWLIRLVSETEKAPRTSEAQAKSEETP